MSLSRSIFAIILVFVLSCVFGTIVHAMLLKPDYMQVAQLYRAPQDTHYLSIFAGYLAFAIGSVWMYRHGAESDKPWLGQGVRFGIALWLVVSVTTFLIAYAVQPLPETLVWKQLAYELVSKIVLGVVTAAIIRA